MSLGIKKKSDYARHSSPPARKADGDASAAPGNHSSPCCPAYLILGAGELATAPPLLFLMPLCGVSP